MFASMNFGRYQTDKTEMPLGKRDPGLKEFLGLNEVTELLRSLPVTSGAQQPPTPNQIAAGATPPLCNLTHLPPVSPPGGGYQQPPPGGYGQQHFTAPPPPHGNISGGQLCGTTPLSANVQSPSQGQNTRVQQVARESLSVNRTYPEIASQFSANQSPQFTQAGVRQTSGPTTTNALSLPQYSGAYISPQFAATGSQVHHRPCSSNVQSINNTPQNAITVWPTGTSGGFHTLSSSNSSSQASNQNSSHLQNLGTSLTTDSAGGVHQIHTAPSAVHRYPNPPPYQLPAGRHRITSSSQLTNRPTNALSSPLQQEVNKNPSTYSKRQLFHGLQSRAKTPQTQNVPGVHLSLPPTSSSTTTHISQSPVQTVVSQSQSFLPRAFINTTNRFRSSVPSLSNRFNVPQSLEKFSAPGLQNRPRRRARGRRPYLNLTSTRPPSTSVAPSGNQPQFRGVQFASASGSSNVTCLPQVLQAEANTQHTATVNSSTFNRQNIDLPSPSTPAFIDTDFTKDLFAEAEAQLAQLPSPKPSKPDMSNVMDLSKTSEAANSSSHSQQQAILTQQQSQQHQQHQQQQQQTPIQTITQFQNAPQAHSMALVGQHIMVQPRTQPAQVTLPLAGSQFSPSLVQSTQQANTQLQINQGQQQLVQGQLSQTQVTQAQVSQLQVGQGQLNQGQIPQQFAQVQFSPLSQTPLAQVRLAQPSSGNNQQGQPNLQQPQSSQARALPAGSTLSLIRPQQFKTVNLSLSSAQTMLAQSQPGTVSASHPQATFINMSSSLGGATLISQPIQMLSTSGVQQMVSSVPVQLTAGQGGQTVLMPLQQSGSIIHQAGVPQMINTLNKNIQPRPPNVITLPTQVQQSILNAQNKGGSISAIASLPVTGTSLPVGTSGGPTATLTIPVASLGMVSPTQVTTTHMTNNLASSPKAAVPGIQTQQVLNIPRLHITRPQLQAIRPTDPRQTLILQQPLRTPEKSPTGLTQIRPRDLQGLRSPDAKIIAIQPQSQVQVFNPNQTPISRTVLLSPPAGTLVGDQQISMPICVTSPTRVMKNPADEATASGSPNKAVGLQPPTLLHFPNTNTANILTDSSPQSSTEARDLPLVVSDKKAFSSTITPTPIEDEIHSKGSDLKCTKDDAAPVGYEEPEFVWEDYLEETGGRAAPETSFSHVECSLKSGIEKGMKVEVTRNVGEQCYWLASIVLASGPLLCLRYEGPDGGGQDFWLDIGSPDLHPVGWGAENGLKPQPPEDLKDKIDDPESFMTKALEGSSVVPSYRLDSDHGFNPVDQIRPGQRLEVQHELCPTAVWVTRIMENVGGRLLLRYEGTDRAQHDFWLFYLDFRLHPIGWAKEMEYIYKPPDVIKGEHQNYAEWSEILQTALKEASENVLRGDIFQDQVKIVGHSFREGWKLEALHPIHRFQICPATVVKVVSKYFIVQIDSLLPSEDVSKLQFLCHGKSPNIFPIRWCQGNGLRITPPAGWKKTEFDWDTYLAGCNNALPAPECAFTAAWPDHEFERGMKLEVVNPSQPGQICAASITRLIDHVMWIHLDSCAKIMANHILPVSSHEIFPVGWCASNNYPLKPPRKPSFNRPGKKVAVVQPERAEGMMSADEYRSATYTQIKAGDGGSSWCPKIYFNHRCFSGPFLSKGRIAELPRCVGPGPIQLVLKEVLTMLINVAYKSSRVLREIQLEGPPDPSMYTQTLKAKYKGKSYCAVVELCRSSNQIEQFCRQVCIKLECCPNLFSPNFVNGNCPENCSQLTKTKYTYYYGKKKRKIGRPPGGHTNLEHGPLKTGKRRKRKRLNLMAHKKATAGDAEPCTPGDHLEDLFDDDRSSKSTDTSSIGNNDLDTDLSMPRKKRKYQHKIPPPSMIKTRGAKLPRYSFERRTHKKIMLSSPPACRIRPASEESSIVSTHTTEPLYKSEDILKLDSNPLYWSVMDVVKFMKTTDCAHLARAFHDQAIDGQALLLLTLPAVQEHLDLKLGPAIKLCHHIERVKVAFYDQYAK